MNYHLWPSNDSPWGFPFAMALMFMSVGLTLWYFKRQRWL
jgi:magnesium transporter